MQLFVPYGTMGREKRCLGMREIVDKDRLEHFFREQQAHFRQRPPVLKLVEFE